MHSSTRVGFGTFEFDLQTEELWRRRRRLKLPPKPAKVLGFLVASPGALVTRETFRIGLWGADTFVDFEHGLNFCIRRIREVLNDDARKPRFIETLPRRGCRFVADVKAISELPVEPGPEAPAVDFPCSSEATKVQAYEHYVKARSAFNKQGKDALQEAGEEFQRALALNPDYAMAHSGLGATMALRMLNRRDPAELDVALSHLQHALDLDPELAEPYPWLCYARIRRAESALAIEAGHTAIALQPNLPQAHYFLGLAYLVTCEEGARNYQRAADQLLHAARVGPHWHPTWFVLSYIALLNGDYESATILANRLADKGNQPGLPFLGAEIVLGSVRMRRGDREGAKLVLVDFLERAAASEHMYRDAMSAVAACVLGEIEIRDGCFDAALSAYRLSWQTLQEHNRIVAHVRISARVQAGMAAAYWALGQRERAEGLLAKATELAELGIPVSQASAAASQAELYLSLAAAHARLGKHREAADLLKRAVLAGWRDAAWLEQDPELIARRGLADFRSCFPEIHRDAKVSFGEHDSQKRRAAL